jgi:thiopurine S-methyltransferase
MEISYWQSRWQKNKSGWHMRNVFPPLKKYWNRLHLNPEAAVLVPLCGKTLDIDWLVRQGHYPIGVDVSEIALKEIMNRQKHPFTSTCRGSFIRYASPSMELWCGDILKIRKDWLPDIHAVYDKAALIALPPPKRQQYAKRIQTLMRPGGSMLLNCFEYLPEEMNGPPFAVFTDELNQLYGEKCSIELLYNHSIFDEVPKFQQRGLQSYLDEKIYQINYINQ